MKKLLRTLIIDDSAYSRRTLSDILEASGECEIVGTARDGEDGIKKALELKPDLITLDLEMPKMDGFTFLRIIMKSLPTPVLVISNMNQSKTVFRAMEMGAVDFIAKPDMKISQDLYDIKEDLLMKVKVISQLQLKNIEKRIREQELGEKDVIPTLEVGKRASPQIKGAFQCLVIGSSTGGPTALQTILSALPGNLPISIAVSQHMPAGFTKAFAERLNKYSQWEVKEAENGDILEYGKAFVAPGGYHMTLRRNGEEVKIEISKRCPEDKYVPSVDKLFLSASEVFANATLGVVLTGMGNDGKEGAIAIKKAGGKVIAESEKTAIVYGMPKEALTANAVDFSLPLEEISREIVELTSVKNWSNNFSNKK